MMNQLNNLFEVIHSVMNSVECDQMGYVLGL